MAIFRAWRRWVLSAALTLAVVIGCGTPVRGQEAEVAGELAGAAGTEASRPDDADDELLLPAVPIVGYSHETNLLFGVMMVRAHRWEGSSPEQPPNTLALSAFYTLNDQWGLGIAPSVYLGGEDYLLKPVLYAHRTPARFWGIGTEAGTSGTREDFTATGIGFTFTATKLVYRSLRVGPALWIASADIRGREPGGLLDGEAVTGADGGRDVGVELQAEWDGRDNIYSATRGFYGLFKASMHRDYLGGDFDYEDYVLDLRHFIPVAPGQVLALQGKTRLVTGDPPFYRLPTLGGIGMMRGLYDGRFRDKTMAAVQAEYRFPIWKRLGGAGFAAVGAVSDSPARYDADDVLVTGGAGLRVTLDPRERIELRLDIGFSRFGAAPILVVTQAF